MDYQLRKLTKVDGLPGVWHLDAFNGHFRLNNVMMRFTYEDRGYALDEDELTKMLQAVEIEKILFVQKFYFLAVQKIRQHFYLFNCHPSAEKSMVKTKQNDPATIIKCRGAADASKLIRKFSGISAGERKYSNVYKITCNVSK